MVRDLNRPMEPARGRAERKWRNNALRKKYKEGKMPIVAIVDPDTIDYENKKIHLKKEAQPADVIENQDPRVNKLETKFVKDIREMMEGHKQRNVDLYIAAIRHEKRKLMIEMIKRLEAKNAEREGAKS